MARDSKIMHYKNFMWTIKADKSYAHGHNGHKWQTQRNKYAFISEAFPDLPFREE